MKSADPELLRSVAQVVGRQMGPPVEPIDAALRQMFSKPTPSTATRIAASLWNVGEEDSVAEWLRRPDSWELAAHITLALLSGEVSPHELAALASKPVVQRLPPEALLAGAQVLTSAEAETARTFLRTALPRINSLQLLTAARRIADSFPTADTPDIRVAVLGNCTLTPMADAIELALRGQALEPQVHCGAYDQWVRELLDEDSTTSSMEPDAIVIYLCSLGLSRSATDLDSDIVELMEQALDSYGNRGAAQVLIVLPEALEEEALGGGPHGAWRRALCAQMRQRFEGRALLIDPHAIVPDWPYASRYYYHAKHPCHPDGLVALGTHLGSVAARLIRRQIKVVVTDLDQTLWGGILGDEGWAGIDLDIHAGGAPFLRLQAFLAHLKQRGTVLCIASKNDDRAVAEAFEKREEMLLSLEDFAVVCAGWQPKSESLRSMASDLNLSLDSFCFLDDSPQERDEIRSVLPDVLVPELPAAPEEYVPFLLRSGWFHAPRLTKEDAERTQMYRADLARRASRPSNVSVGDFLSSLEIEVEPLPVDDGSLLRVSQLVAKTNQFNLTTRRHDTPTLRELAEREDAFTWCYRVLDRFGDSGVVGVLLALPLPDTAEYIIDTWILSCRVMGRTVEQAMFRHLVGWLRERGGRILVGEYIATQKNGPVADLLPRLGFTPIPDWDSETQGYRFATPDPIEGPCFAKLRDPAPNSERHGV